MCDDHAVNRAYGRDRNIINNPVNRVAQKFETRDKSNIDLTARKPLAERRWMTKVYLASPPSDERTSVEVFDAADAKGFQSG